MKQYIASLEIENKLQDLAFQTDGNPIDYLWSRYGISTYIERIDEVTKKEAGKETEETKIETAGEEDILEGDVNGNDS